MYTSQSRVAECTDKTGHHNVSGREARNRQNCGTTGQCGMVFVRVIREQASFRMYSHHSLLHTLTVSKHNTKTQTVLSLSPLGPSKHFSRFRFGTSFESCNQDTQYLQSSPERQKLRGLQANQDDKGSLQEANWRCRTLDSRSQSSQ